jgi:polar amino acid transport system substrate-binding protein
MQYPRYPLSLLPHAILVWIALVPAGACKQLTLAITRDVPPYIMQQGKTGLEVEILREALAFRGHTFTHIQAPYGRLQVMVSQGMADAAAGTRRQPDGTFYSDHFIAFYNVLVTRAVPKRNIRSVADLKNLRLVAWQNAYRDLGDAFFDLFNPDRNQGKPHYKKYYEVPSQLSQVKMFWAGHADALVIDKYIFAALTARVSDQFNTDAAVEYHDLFEPETRFRVNFRTRELRDDFNQGLAELRDSGRYAELVSKYLSTQE